MGESMIDRKSVERDGYIDRLLTSAAEGQDKDKTAETFGLLSRSLLKIAKRSLLGLKLRGFGMASNDAVG